jgi:hypothetical protein
LPGTSLISIELRRSWLAQRLADSCATCLCNTEHNSASGIFLLQSRYCPNHDELLPHGHGTFLVSFADENRIVHVKVNRVPGARRPPPSSGVCQRHVLSLRTHDDRGFVSGSGDSLGLRDGAGSSDSRRCSNIPESSGAQLPALPGPLRPSLVRRLQIPSSREAPQCPARDLPTHNTGNEVRLEVEGWDGQRQVVE